MKIKSFPQLKWRMLLAKQFGICIKGIMEMERRNGYEINLREFKEKITHIKVDCKSFKSFTANYTKSKQLKIKYFNNFVLNFQYNTHERKQTPSQDTEIIITSNITIPFQNICICIQDLY